jgi:hydrogenase-4 membrane subunit HyfE
MEQIISPQILFIAEALILLSVISMHLMRKSVYVVYLYISQSLVVSLLLIYSAFTGNVISLLAVAILVLIVKVLIAPRFFLRLIKKLKLQFSTNSYLNMSVTLVVLAVITAATHSKVFQTLGTLTPVNEKALLASFSAMFISLFLIINRKGAFSQMIGVLSLENSIVAFIFAAGLEQGPGLELGIIFDIFVWIVIATFFISNIYKKFDTLDVTVMTHLKG